MMNRPPSAHAPQQYLFQQKTLSREVAITGVGIHTGKPIRLRLRPAAPDTGIVFRRTDLGGTLISALSSEVSSVELATTLGHGEATVSTVEHLLAALRIEDIDNVLVELDGPEIPILDGSALPFLRLLEAAGTTYQDAGRRILAVTAPLEVTLGAKRIRVSPYPGLRISYSIDFAVEAIGHQEIDLVIERESFLEELAAARTFAMAAEVERLKSRGLGLGGAVDNCVVFSEHGPINTRLRFEDEPVRHKTLDAVGDLGLLGAPLWAHVEIERGGHQLHYAMVAALLERPDCWTWLEGAPRPATRTERRDRSHLRLAAAG
jgi:UDP-3-O-[3-hydroxymyristoyl] N-acetylglucosamine deacetylase